MTERDVSSGQPKYRRIMIKLSGEALMGEQGFGLHPPTVERIAEELCHVHQLNTEICIVIGGGNIFRGVQGVAHGMERTSSDYMGMLGTVINALAMQSTLEAHGIQTRVLSAIPMHEVCEPFILRRAMRHLDKGRICIFAAGTGSPYFTTDTAAALRASEMGCDVIFKATKVDGVYDRDPGIDSSAKRYKTLSYNEALQKDLKVMDASALAIARDNALPLIVFHIMKRGGLHDILLGGGTYTIIG
ncbi:MAG: UMP kinase [Rhodobacteraceae bacterium]|nr:UMP kinase [Paracoccaceae bacterium]MCY4195408.1 UMP kinase [Paracoccaceae bacterium]